MNAVMNPNYAGTIFEQRFLDEVKAQGLYAQKMPARDGFDFLIGSRPMVVELKYVNGNRLKLKWFTPIEIITAESMTRGDVDYNVVFPLYGTFGVVTWGEIKGKLFSGGITLDSPFHRRFFKEV
jgi:hypothetical protein